ncbi:transposase [Pseudorhodobacter turbinis]|uniref:Transposase n=1 Tax=Pseudorhodobacter turbinis TaxID=2500533 RepID=A0A4P8EF39_9RHOB|nr:transposase [Pseudorhodobacter turbinis]
MVLLAHIREQHRLSLQSYGRPRMTEELQELGLSVGHRRVGRLMRENGIKIVRKPTPRAVWMGWVLIGYGVSLWPHTRTPPACKFYLSLTRVVDAVGRMMRRSGSLRKTLAMA